MADRDAPREGRARMPAFRSLTVRRLATVVLVMALCAGLAPAWAEEPAAPPPSTAPSPAETQPLPSTTDPDPTTKPGEGTPAPTPQQAPLPPNASEAAPPPAAASTLPTLVPDPTDTNDVDEVSLPAKPAAILSGGTNWDDAVKNLSASFKTIEDKLAKAGIKVAGRPLAVFTKTEDDGFQYEAMIPIAAAPADAPADTDGLRYGSTPTGKALRYRHSGSYNDIDGTYETFVAYLDAKEIEVQERFVEEYVTDLKPGAEDKLDINIYALAK